jgi:hypothetical protein
VELLPTEYANHAPLRVLEVDIFLHPAPPPSTQLARHAAYARITRTEYASTAKTQCAQRAHSRVHPVTTNPFHATTPTTTNVPSAQGASGAPIIW